MEVVVTVTTVKSNFLYNRVIDHSNFILSKNGIFRNLYKLICEKWYSKAVKIAFSQKSLVQKLLWTKNNNFKYVLLRPIWYTYLLSGSHWECKFREYVLDFSKNNF